MVIWWPLYYTGRWWFHWKTFGIFTPKKPGEKSDDVLRKNMFPKKGDDGVFCHELAQPTNYMVLYQEQTDGVSDSI